MRDDFAVFITTHERADRQTTLDWFLGHGYSGKWFLVIDDGDKEQAEYIEKYNSHVLLFNKLKYWEELDTFNNRKHLAAVLYARQAVEDFAMEMQLKTFLVCDDDISCFVARYPGEDNKMKRSKKVNADRMIEAYLKYLVNANMASLNPGTQNLYLTGADKLQYKLIRKGSNAFFRSVDFKIKWISAMNEDLITCIEYNKRGVLMCTALPICAECPKAGTGSIKGGMHEIYADMGEYERAFYAVIEDPSRCFVKMNTTKKGPKLRIARKWAGGSRKLSIRSGGRRAR